MKSRDAILLAKLGKKNPQISAVDTANDGRGFQGIDGDKLQEKTFEPRAKQGGSLELLKATKAGSLPTASANLGGYGSLPTANLEKKPIGDVELGPTKVKTYSPIKNYLKKGK